MAVYFIRAGAGGPVKIGRAIDPEARMFDLQIGNHETLFLLRVIEGDYPTETWLHRHFASRRRRAEWFEFCDEMLTIAPPSKLSARADRNDLMSRAIAAAGSQTLLAERLGVTREHVCGLRRPSPQMAARIEIATNGAVRRYEFRPDLYPDEESRASVDALYEEAAA